MKAVEYALGVVSTFCYGRRFRRERRSITQRTSSYQQNCCDDQAVAAGFVVAEEHEVERLEGNEYAELNCARGEAISSLLADECFLRKVLGAAVDDGLQECRLVCRKWRKVCDSLPVKLTVMNRDDMQRVPSTFPQASTLSLHLYSGDRSVEGSSLNRDEPVDGWLDPLTKLTRLIGLTVEVMYVSDLFHETGSSFLLLAQLQSLALTVIGDLNADRLFLGVRLLTNLTSLHLIAKSVWVVPPSAEPVVEIQRLTELELSENLFSNRAGRLMFPHLAHLTHLGFADRPKLLSKVYELCGTSLQSLRIGSCDDYGSAVVDWPILLQFSKLDHLAFDNVSNYTGVVERVVRQIIFLTGLRFNGSNYGRRVTVDMLATLSGLRSLCYLPRDGSTESDAVALHISHLTQLTGLTTILYNKRIPFRSLTSLIAVDILVSVQLDVSDTISRLTLLEALKVVNRQQSCLETPSVLRSLKHLQSATLEMPNDIGGDFFPALASLPALTFLQFNCQNHGYSIPFLSEISLVTTLKKLSVEHVVTAHPLRFLQSGSLPRLRSLRIQPFPDLEKTREELRRRFPCITRITP